MEGNNESPEPVLARKHLWSGSRLRSHLSSRVQTGLSPLAFASSEEAAVGPNRPAVQRGESTERRPDTSSPWKENSFKRQKTLLQWELVVWGRPEGSAFFIMHAVLSLLRSHAG